MKHLTLLLPLAVIACTSAPSRPYLDQAYSACLQGEAHACSLMSRLEDQTNWETTEHNQRVNARDRNVTARLQAAMGGGGSYGQRHYTYYPAH